MTALFARTIRAPAIANRVRSAPYIFLGRDGIDRGSRVAASQAG